MREPDVDRERDAAPAAPAQLTVMSSGSAARPGPEGPSGIVRVEPETRSERVGKSVLGFRTSGFSRPESRKSGSGFRQRNPGPPARADRKPRLGCPDSRSARAVNPGWPAPQSPGARIGKPEQKTGSEGRGYGPGSLLRPRSLLPRVLPTAGRTCTSNECTPAACATSCETAASDRDHRPLREPLPTPRDSTSPTEPPG